ncbi:2-keto-4-pentenoate hydratase [Salininema proteolyticum]|uniref:2-keto-4-pentenoate hydratase n=1 Tax=Salininema proteolyticum TaxID=1607685 RepID=A0ABV8U2P5_9ACTN
MDLYDTIAARLYEAERTGEPISPVRGEIGERDLESAYRVQERLVRKHVAEGARAAGWKVGVSSPAALEAFAMDEPVSGVLLAENRVRDGGVITADGLSAPRVEVEVALVLAEDLSAPRSVAEAAAAVDYAVPALEVVDSRFRWDVAIADLVADNTAACRYVLGSDPRKLGEVDVAGVRTSLSRDGVEVSTGSGADTAGSPLNALFWLAGRRDLKAGEVVLTGALGTVVPVERGGAFRAEVSGLGGVSVSFA